MCQYVFYVNLTVSITCFIVNTKPYIQYFNYSDKTVYTLDANTVYPLSTFVWNPFVCCKQLHDKFAYDYS